jgi:hypothetical protein
LGAVGRAALPLLLLGVVAFIDLPLCPSRCLFGIPCPGCGLTRATIALLRGELVAALRYHPLAPLLAPLVIGVLGKPILEELGWIPRGQISVRLPRAAWAALAIAFFGLYFARLGGLLGGLPDPIDPASGVIGRVLAKVVAAIGALCASNASTASAL